MFLLFFLVILLRKVRLCSESLRGRAELMMNIFDCVVTKPWPPRFCQTHLLDGRVLARATLWASLVARHIPHSMGGAVIAVARGLPLWVGYLFRNQHALFSGRPCVSSSAVFASSFSERCTSLSLSRSSQSEGGVSESPWTVRTNSWGEFGFLASAAVVICTGIAMALAAVSLVFFLVQICGCRPPQKIKLCFFISRMRLASQVV